MLESWFTPATASSGVDLQARCQLDGVHCRRFFCGKRSKTFHQHLPSCKLKMGGSLTPPLWSLTNWLQGSSQLPRCQGVTSALSVPEAPHTARQGFQVMEPALAPPLHPGNPTGAEWTCCLLARCLGNTPAAPPFRARSPATILPEGSCRSFLLHP